MHSAEGLVRSLNQECSLRRAQSAKSKIQIQLKEQTTTQKKIEPHTCLEEPSFALFQDYSRMLHQVSKGHVLACVQEQELECLRKET